MQKNNLIHIPFYEFTCPDYILKESNDQLARSQWRGNFNNVISIHFKNTILKNWFDKCLKELKEKELRSAKPEIKTCLMWANKTTKFKFHHKHSHPNSIISGILYLNSAEGMGKTKFYYPNPWWHFQNAWGWWLDDQGQAVEYEYEVVPKTGMLILFPSHIRHSTSPNLCDEDRYTISFNSFVAGEIGDFGSANYIKFNDLDED